MDKSLLPVFTWIYLTHLVFVNGLVNSSAICGPIFYDNETGIISSPNFPNNYPPNVRCLWILDATPGFVLGIRFTDFALQSISQCGADYLKVTDGKSLEKRYCGSDLPARETSGSRALQIEFVADSSVQLRGFSLQFRRIPLGQPDTNICGTVPPMSLSGTIPSPRFPAGPYPPNTYCVWRIEVPDGDRIAIGFSELDLEISARCVNDYITITDGSTQLGPYCNGTVLPPIYTSESSALEVMFYSDSAQSGRGFLLNWSRLPGFCRTLPSTQFGSVNCTNDNRIGSVCSHICSEGMEIDGEDMSTCTYSNTGIPIWTNPQTRCVVSCLSNGIESGVADCSNGQSVGSTCQFQCGDNYYLQGDSRSTCTMQDVFSASWVPSLPNCIGAPIPSILMQHNVIPSDNRVTFTCMFAGFPLPLIEWKYENGSTLPQNSQFQVSAQQNASEYEASRQLTVYGMACQNTSLLRFQCFASNIHTTNPVESGSFATDIDIRTSLRFISSSFTCQEAISHCEERGLSLAVPPNSAVMNRINSEIPVSDSTYWVSSLSESLASSWESEVGFVSAHSDGCIKVLRSQGVWASDQTTPSAVLCQTRPPPPRPRISTRSNTCRGDVLSVRWNFLPGAETIPHLVYVSSDIRVLSPPGSDTVIVRNLTGNTQYNLQVIPLFEGCPSDLIVANASTTGTTGNDPTMRVESISHLQNPTNGTCTISWRNANFNHYEITYTKIPAQRRMGDSGFEPVTESIRLDSTANQYLINGLEPNTKYSVEIGSVPPPPCNDEVPTLLSPIFENICVTNPSVPDTVPLSSQTPYEKDNKLFISLSPVDEKAGPLSCYIVVVQRNSSGLSPVNQFNFTRLKQAGAAVNDSDPFVAFVSPRIDALTELSLGDDSLTCCDPSRYDSSSNCPQNKRKRRSTLPLIRAQNRPLQEGESFNYYVIATVPSGNTTLIASSDISVTFQSPILNVDSSPGGTTNNGLSIFKPWYIMVVIAVAIVLVAVLIAVIVIRRRKAHKNTQTFTISPRVATMETDNAALVVQMTPNAGQPEPAYCEPFVQYTAKEFEDYSVAKADLTSAYLRKSAESNLLFKKEFKRILTGFPIPPTKYARQPECRDKNRNEDYLPSDQRRVHLESIGSGWGSDYINAAFVDGFTSHNAFIAAQGPMEHTVEDFWKMVLENHCTKIVMLSRLIENRTMKCESYWADVGKKEDFGNITVTTKSVQNIGHHIQRDFVVKPKDHPNSFLVTQFQFMTWPDHDVPTTTTPILRFREAVLAEHTDGTILVHGGVGGGRTGTFLALLVLWEQLDRCNEMNAVEVIKKLRDAKTGMVETLKQYVFLHKLLCELTTLPATDCLASEFPKYFKRMKDVNGSHTTNMKTQFDQLDELAVLHDEPHIAKRKSEKASIKPYKRTGVSTDHMLIQRGRKAINSLHLSTIQTYNPDVYFLSGQCPSRSKYQAFWNCIWEFKITCIIRIDEKEKCLQNFFIVEGDKYAFDDVTVCLTKTEQHFGYTEKSLKVYKGGSLSPLCVQQIELTAWPISGFPSNYHTVVSVASRVKNHRPSQTSAKDMPSKKILSLILCSDGSTRSGAFCAIFNLLDRLDREARVDVFREVKELRDCRTRMVGNIYQYEFIFQAIAEYIEEFNPYQEMQ